jgi:hypothetical protein
VRAEKVITIQKLIMNMITQLPGLLTSSCILPDMSCALRSHMFFPKIRPGLFELSAR